MKYLPKIKVYKRKGEFDYDVVIGRGVFEMSHDANQPNGVNIYAGEIGEKPGLYARYFGKKIPARQIPVGVKKGIKQRLQFERMVKRK